MGELIVRERKFSRDKSGGGGEVEKISIGLFAGMAYRLGISWDDFWYRHTPNSISFLYHSYLSVHAKKKKTISQGEADRIKKAAERSLGPPPKVERIDKANG